MSDTADLPSPTDAVASDDATAEHGVSEGPGESPTTTTSAKTATPEPIHPYAYGYGAGMDAADITVWPTYRPTANPNDPPWVLDCSTWNQPENPVYADCVETQAAEQARYLNNDPDRPEPTGSAPAPEPSPTAAPTEVPAPPQ